MTHVTQFVVQQAFRGRNDDGSEVAATWKAASNTNFNQPRDEVFRLRFLIEETAGGAANNYSYLIEYNRNNTGWQITGMTGDVNSSPSVFVAEATPTTQQIGAGSFVAGEFDSDSSASNISLTAQQTEMEYCLTLDSTLVNVGDTIQFRVTNNGAVLDSYAVTPTVTVASAGPILNAPITLGNSTLSADASATLSADFSKQLENITLASDISAPLNLDASLGLSDLTISSDSNLFSVIDGSSQLANLQLSGAVEVDLSIDSSFNLGSLTLSSGTSAQASIDSSFTLDNTAVSSDSFLVTIMYLLTYGDQYAFGEVPFASVFEANDGPVEANLSETLGDVSLSSDTDVVASIQSNISLDGLLVDSSISLLSELSASIVLDNSSVSSETDAIATISSTSQLESILVSSDIVSLISIDSDIQLLNSTVFSQAISGNIVNSDITLNGVSVDSNVSSDLSIFAGLQLSGVEVSSEADAIVGLTSSFNLLNSDLNSDVSAIATGYGDINIGLVTLYSDIDSKYIGVWGTFSNTNSNWSIQDETDAVWTDQDRASSSWSEQ